MVKHFEGFLQEWVSLINKALDNEDIDMPKVFVMPYPHVETGKMILEIHVNDQKFIGEVAGKHVRRIN